MEGSYIMGRGADGAWHLWVGSVGGGAIARATVRNEGEIEYLDPPKTWKEIELEISSWQGSEWLKEPSWSQKTAFVFAYALALIFEAGSYPAKAVADQAHHLWWLGEGGHVRTIDEDHLRQWLLELARRGKWGQLELPGV